MNAFCLVDTGRTTGMDANLPQAVHAVSTSIETRLLPRSAVVTTVARHFISAQRILSQQSRLTVCAKCAYPIPIPLPYPPNLQTRSGSRQYIKNASPSAAVSAIPRSVGPCRRSEVVQLLLLAPILTPCSAYLPSVVSVHRARPIALYWLNSLSWASKFYSSPCACVTDPFHPRQPPCSPLERRCDTACATPRLLRSCRRRGLGSVIPLPLRRPAKVQLAAC